LIKELIANVSYAEAAESISHIDSIDSPEEMSEWLKQVESELAKGDFSYRKAEIEKLKEKLQIN